MNNFNNLDKILFLIIPTSDNCINSNPNSTLNVQFGILRNLPGAKIFDKYVGLGWYDSYVMVWETNIETYNLQYLLQFQIKREEFLKELNLLKPNEETNNTRSN